MANLGGKIIAKIVAEIMANLGTNLSGDSQAKGMAYLVADKW